MSEPFLSEIKIFSFNFAPRGWQLCNGAQLPINQNQALFSLLGTTFGGDGRTTFALPNLQGRVPIGQGGGFKLAEVGGETAHTLTPSELPLHSHIVTASIQTAGTNVPGANSFLASSAPNDLYTGYGAPVALAPGTVSLVGDGQPHANMMPSLTLNFCIALQGIFPSQN